MPRNKEDARARLQQAALELYLERGYEQTTTAEIAARAGVTERTFFRHFPDKREVFFDGEAALRDTLVQAIVAAPAALGPLPALLHASRSVEQLVEDNRHLSAPRQRAIAAAPALQERQLAKMAMLIEAMAAALRQRGVAAPRATLAAQTGAALFTRAAAACFGDSSLRLGACLDRAYAELRALLAESSGPAT